MWGLGGGGEMGEVLVEVEWSTTVTDSFWCWCIVTSWASEMETGVPVVA